MLPVLRMEGKMRERYIPAFIMLIAAAITSIINIVRNVEVLTGLKRLLLVIVLFYIVGLIVKAIVKRAFVQKPKTEEETDDFEEDSEETEETDDNREENAKTK
jgi:fructose-specific phosphotransferase system IIC component